MNRSSRHHRGRWLALALVAVAAGLAVWQFWPAGGDGGPRPDANTALAGAKKAGGPADGAKGGKASGGIGPRDANTNHGGSPATQEAPANGEVLKLQELDPAEALAAVRKGEQLLASSKLAEARAELSKAILSGKLPQADEETVRKTLLYLADKMLFSPQVFDGDAYTFQYAFQAGDLLAKVERTLGLHVPAQALLKANGMDDAKRIRAGQTFKMIRGPFHAVVTKGKFVLDLYLHRKGCEPVFVRRLKVGLGKDGSTPVGLWRVKLGSKQERANWYPPPNSPIQKAIAWSEPDYPLGTRGFWIGLEGLDENTRNHLGYGIHGTSDPDSIGRAESLGCIRLADPDIELVFSLLYEHWSTVRVRP